MKRLLQLLLRGEPDALVSPTYRYFIGIDLGLREDSVAVVGHLEDDVFFVDHIRSWQGFSYLDHEREVACVMDAYNIVGGWVDSYQSAALVRSFLNIVQVRHSPRVRQVADQIGSTMVEAGLIRPVSFPVPGKRSDYFAQILKQLRPTGEAREIDAEKDQYVQALRLVVWGTVTTEPSAFSEKFRVALYT